MPGSNDGLGGGHDDVELDRHVEEVLAVAKEECREDVMDNFCGTLLRSYVSEHHAARTPRDIFMALQSAVDCREEILEIERNMDKAHFIELVTGGYFVAGGADKDTGLPIFWVQSGRLAQDIWKYKRGSPRANAYLRFVFGVAHLRRQLRALIFRVPVLRLGDLVSGISNTFFRSLCAYAVHLQSACILFAECAIVQAVRNSRPFGWAFYADESERRALDFNFEVEKQYMRITVKMTLGMTKKIALGGTNRFFNIIQKICRMISPAHARSFFLIDHDQVEDLVVNPKDVPMFWFNDDEGKPYVPTDRRNVWCYERCLSETNRITSKDIYNPGPWTFEEVDYEALLEKNKDSRGSGALKPIVEGEGDDW